MRLKPFPPMLISPGAPFRTTQSSWVGYRALRRASVVAFALAFLSVIPAGNLLFRIVRFHYIRRLVSAVDFNFEPGPIQPSGKTL
jgi:hypothetical protein